MIRANDFEGYPRDGRVRLVERLSDVGGFYVCDGDPIYAAVLDGAGERQQEVETSCLRLLVGAKLRPVNELGETEELGEERGFDIIRLVSWASDREFSAFIELCRMHASEGASLSFEVFFYSLSELFRPNREQSVLNAYGLYGELAYIDLLSETRAGLEDPTDYWQLDGPTSKYDFVFPKGNVEIKSSSRELEVTIKHDQLFGSDRNYLVVVGVEKDPSGETLQDLADRLTGRVKCFSTLRSRVELSRRLLQVEERDLKKRMSVCFVEGFKAQSINPFPSFSDRVSRLSYKLNLADLPWLDENELISKLI